MISFLANMANLLAYPTKIKERAMEEVLPEGKNFRLVKEDELPEIIEFLENHLPDSIKFHQTLKTYLKDRVWDFHFYVTKTWPEQPVILHFPGMTLTPNNKLYESFSVFCPNDRLELLELLKTEDLLIDWTQPIFLNYIHSKIMDKIEDFYGKIGSVEKLYGDIYGLEDYEKPTEEECDGVCAEEAQVLQLRPEHARIIHDLYPANQMECIEVFEKLLEKFPCYGIFTAQGELGAWMVQSYYGAMFSMQVLPEFRRKGYGMVVAKYLTKLVIERGYLPFVVIRPENDASKGLYAKLGFKKYFGTVRAILRPYEMTSDSQGGGGGTVDTIQIVAQLVEPLVEIVEPIEMMEVIKNGCFTNSVNEKNGHSFENGIEKARNGFENEKIEAE